MRSCIPYEAIKSYILLPFLLTISGRDPINGKIVTIF